MHFDVFNGDADGIIALLQLRLASPKESTLISGVKRDIDLLAQVDVNKASSVTVLDISLEKNKQALDNLLNAGIDIFYVDHHRTGDIPQSPKLTTILDTDANTCTSLLINNHLNGRFSDWAIAAAFGDNMHVSAIELAKEKGLSGIQQSQLNELGTYINYNGYGQHLSDLHFNPVDLFKSLLEFPDPFQLIKQKKSLFSQLKEAYLADMVKAESSPVLSDCGTVKTVLLENAPWSRRVSGVCGNALANESPNKAHIVVTLLKNTEPVQQDNHSKRYTVSLRAPLNNKQGAGDLCAMFATGGGRAAAGGINVLPHESLDKFIDVVANFYR
jgi:hypothetical protein